MEILIKKIDEIMPYERNPRINEKAVDYLMNSLEEFDWQQPIVVDKAGVIVAGHTRYEAAKRLGIKEVPVKVMETDNPYKVAAYRLADNKISEFSYWDYPQLEEELAEIDGYLDMDDFGFGFEDTDFSMIEDLINEEFAKDSSIEQHDSFNITFTFPNEQKDLINLFIKENGKEDIVDKIIKEALEWQG